MAKRGTRERRVSRDDEPAREELAALRAQTLEYIADLVAELETLAGSIKHVELQHRLRLAHEAATASQD